jgi:hypothetical protein
MKFGIGDLHQKLQKFNSGSCHPNTTPIVHEAQIKLYNFLKRLVIIKVPDDSCYKI